jgi:UTP--glucose-1-phosphate uridylyltransferase
MHAPPQIAVLPVFSSGTRLLPLTYGIPKELLPLERYTLLHHAMKAAVMAGISQFVLLATRSISLRPYVLDGEHARTLKALKTYSLDYPDQYRDTYEVTKEWFALLERVVSFVPPRIDMPGGLASAIASVEHLVAGRPFAFFLPDDFIQNPEAGLPTLVRFWERFGGWAVSLTRIQAHQFEEFGVVEATPSPDGAWTVTGATEKPSSQGRECGLGIVGRYIFDENVFRLIRETQETVMQENSQSGFHLTEAINRFAKAGRVVGATVNSPYFHVGTIQGYLDAWRHVNT